MDGTVRKGKVQIGENQSVKKYKIFFNYVYIILYCIFIYIELKK